MPFDAVSGRLGAHAGGARCKPVRLMLDTDSTARRPDRLHENVHQRGTVFNTAAPGAELTVVLRRQNELA
jgi:hypothetical protein